MAWFDQITQKFVANVATRYMQEAPWAPLSIFPKINVKQKSGYIAEYTKEDWMRVGDPKDYIRSGASESIGDSISHGYQPYFLEKRSLHTDLTEDDRNEYDNPFDPVTDSTEWVIDTLGRVAAKLFSDTVFTTGVWGLDFDVTASSTKWSSSTSTPITDVLNQSQAIEAFTGFRPNKMVMTRDVFNALKVNSQIRDSMKVTTDKVVTEALLAKLFEVDIVQVFRTVETTAKKGQKSTKDNTNFMATNKVLLCYTPQRASKKRPSAGYHLAYKGKYGNVITRTFPMPQLNNALRIEGDIFIAPKIVSPDLGTLFINVI